MTTKTVNKHLFVWLGSFMRGQIGMGICKLLFNWATLGIWSFVDWIVALVKAYSTYNDTEDITFINGGYSR